MLTIIIDFEKGLLCNVTLYSFISTAACDGLYFPNMIKIISPITHGRYNVTMSLPNEEREVVSDEVRTYQF